MLNSMPISEKIQLQKAIKYGKTLKGGTLLSVITTDELPKSIPVAINEIIRISSIPVARLNNSASDEELFLWLASFLKEFDGNKILFKPSEIFWKLWLVVLITDFNEFIKNYLSNSFSKDFYLADIFGKQVNALMNEEHNYELFIH